MDECRYMRTVFRLGSVLDRQFDRNAEGDEVTSSCVCVVIHMGLHCAVRNSLANGRMKLCQNV